MRRPLIALLLLLEAVAYCQADSPNPSPAAGQWANLSFIPSDRHDDVSRLARDRPVGLEPLAELKLGPVFQACEGLVNSYQPADVAGDDRDPYRGTQEVLGANWLADNLSHRTLYFQDLCLERHGQSHSPVVQPSISFLRFMTDALVGPLRMMHVPPRECHFIQCEGRPGSPCRGATN